jgi:hypothetical protein
MLPNPKSSVLKPQLNESEAAQQLGVTVEELRTIIRRHIVTDDVDPNNVPMTTFQPSDLVLLRLLAKNSFSSTTAN